MKKIKFLYILSNDYVVKIKTNGIQIQASLHDFMDVELLKGPKVLDHSLAGSSADNLVEQILSEYKPIGEINDFNGWSNIPSIIEIQGPPPPIPPIIKEYTIEGRVADKNTLEPIQGIKVFISSSLPNNEDPPQDKKIGFETKTNKEGNYELTFKIKTEETTPDVFNVLETPKLQFQSEDNSYGIEKKSPYIGDNSSKTVRSSLDIVQMKPFVSDLKKETTKLQNISADALEKIKNSIPKDPFQALQKAVSKKIQDILKKFIPLIIGLIAKFGISKLTEAIENKFSDFDKKNCPHPDELRKIIRKRNRIVKILNSIYKFVDALVKAAGIVLTLIQIFRLIKGIVVSLPIPQAIGVPPAKDFGGLISAQPMSSTLKSANNLDQFESLIKKYEGLTIMVLAILSVLKAVLKMAIDLLNGLDAMLQTCMQDAVDKNELQLEIINQELQDLFAEEKEIIPPSPFINGFQISVVEDNKSPIGKLKRRYAIAKNKLGIIMLKGEPSFSSSDQILIDELKFYITQNDLKAN
jgi:ribosomal 50S subunit-associated protein YjgA (DUF615 family)